MNTEELIAILRRDSYCLVTDTNGVEPKFDESGNLLVCNPESGDLMPVPNVDAVRKLYDLPEKNGYTERSKTILGIKTSCIGKSYVPDGGDLMPVPNATRQLYGLSRKRGGTKRTGKTVLGVKKSPIRKTYISNGGVRDLVWLGQRSVKCVESSKLLIKLVDSELYKRLMNNRNVVKLKVWELIGKEIENHGYKIAYTPKEVALRTFQKWRNLERTYWRFKKDAQDVNQEYPKKKKPYFFDEIHNVISKREDYAKKYASFFSGKGEEKINGNQFPIVNEIEIEILSDDNIHSLSTGGKGEEKLNGTQYPSINDINIGMLSDDNIHSLSTDSKGESNGNQDPSTNDIELEMLCEGNSSDSIQSLAKGSKGGSDVNLGSSNNGIEEMLNIEHSSDDIHSLSTGTVEKNQEAPPKEAIRLLVYLASKKYKYLKKSTTIRGIRFWERIYDEIIARGYGFATSRREGAMKLRKHWNKNKRLLKRQYRTKMPNASTSLIEEVFLEHKGEGSLAAGSEGGNEFNLGSSNNNIEEILCDENSQDDTRSLLSTGSKGDGNGNQDPSNNDIELEMLCEDNSRDSTYSLATGTIDKRQETPPEEVSNPSASLSKETLLEHKDDSLVPDESPCSPNMNQNDDEVVTALLHLLNTPKFYKLSQNYENFPWVWEKIYYQLSSMGLHIAGTTVKAKSKTLYQKWKSLKRSFMKYERDKSRGLTVEEPAHSDLLLNIVYGNVISKRASKPVGMDSQDFVNPTLDHDYNKSEPETSLTLHAQSLVEASADIIRAPVSTATYTQANLCCIHANNSTNSECQTTFTALGQPSTTNGQSDHSNIALKKMLSQNLAAQQENFDKVISLLTEQLNQQKTLNALVGQYIANVFVDQARKKADRKQKKLQKQNAKNSGGNSYEFLNSR